MTKEEVRKYLDELPYETSGLVLFSLEEVVSRDTAAEMGGLTDENDPKAMHDAAERIMRDYSIQSKMDGILADVTGEYMQRQGAGDDKG